LTSCRTQSIEVTTAAHIGQSAAPRLAVENACYRRQRDQFLKLTERYRVVQQTIRNGPEVDVVMASAWAGFRAERAAQPVNLCARRG